MKTFLPLLVVLALVSPALAADVYMTPTGAGKRDGSSWQNALDRSALPTAVDEKLRPGDRLLLGGGTYDGGKIVVTAGGTAGKPKSVVGVDRGAGLPVLAGTWSVDKPTKGGVAIRLDAGASHVNFEKLRLRGFVTAVQAHPVKDGAAGRSHVSFNDVDAEQIRHGFYLSDCDDLTLVDCDLKRYSKHGFRFEGGCDRVKVSRCVADCSKGDAEWEKKTELFPFGFNVNDGGPNTAFAFEDCLARNNVMPLQKNSYKNGDGFVVEATASDVSFVRCRSVRNQDGGFDLKVRDVKLTGCVSIGNSRGYRIWSTATLTNCFVGFGGTGLWCNGGPVTITRSTFHALKNAAVLTDDKATELVTLADCLVSEVGATAKHSAKGKAVVDASTMVAGAADPKYVKPDPTWDGSGDAMDSRAYPNKGYRAGGKP